MVIRSKNIYGIAKVLLVPLQLPQVPFCEVSIVQIHACILFTRYTVKDYF